MKLNKDEFAKWMFNIGLTRERYNFDVIYDIKAILEKEEETIAEKRNENFGNYPTKEPVYDKFYLMIRDLGTYISEEKEGKEWFNSKLDFSEKVYELTFCWNRDYFQLPYCQVKVIKDKEKLKK